MKGRKANRCYPLMGLIAGTPVSSGSADTGTNNEFSRDDNNEFRGVNLLKNDVWPGRYQLPSFHNDEAFVVSKVTTRTGYKVRHFTKFFNRRCPKL